jgi:hypothetical protein
MRRGIAHGITGFRTIAARGKRVDRKEDREAEFPLKQGSVEVVGKTVVGDSKDGKARD